MTRLIMKKKIVMYVYNDITTDARVQRAAEALADEYDLTLISTNSGKVVKNDIYTNILVGCKRKGFKGLFNSLFSTIKIIKSYQPDVVYCNDYYSALLAYYLLRTNFSGSIIYDAHELIIPEEGKKDKRQRFFYWFERHIVHKINLLICASQQRAEIMKEHYRLLNEPVVIPNISQLRTSDDDADTQKIILSLHSFFNKTLPTVVYAGVVTSQRRISELFDAALAMSDKCKLLIIGDGNALNSLKLKSAHHPELHTAFTGAIPYKCLGSILSRCDIGFIYYPVETLNNRYCASNKIYEYASVGLPMLANENPTIKEEFEKYHIGISTNNLKWGLNQLLEHPDSAKQNCHLFTQNNQWKYKAALLRDYVAKIIS